MAKHYRSAALLFAAFAATACATGAEYQPRTPGTAVGYTDLQLSANRYRVTYSGSWYSTRDDVETYLLRRAAEVTLQNGYSHFVVQMQQTERMIDNLGTPYPYGPVYYPAWGDAWTASSYASYAEILLLKDDESANAADAIDAQRVLVSLNALQPPSSFKTAAGGK
jgi:hypothetical protein